MSVVTIRQVPRLSFLSYARGSSQEQSQFIKHFYEGLKDYGFVVLVDHTLEQKKIDEAYGLITQLFDLPEHIKNRYSGADNGGQRGYTAFGREHARDCETPDLKEFWHVGRTVPSGHPYFSYFPDNFWPKEVPDFRPVMMELYNTLDGVSAILLDALGKALDVPNGYFTQMIHEGNSVLRLIHYPEVKEEDKVCGIRAAPHGDINLITMLMGATDDGLQLLDRDGQWLDVNVGPGEIVIDSGDMLSRITNDVIPAMIHRVINPDNSHSRRYSMPFFVHPHPKAMLTCLPSCRGETIKYPPISSHDFLMERLREIGLK